MSYADSHYPVGRYPRVRFHGHKLSKDEVGGAVHGIAGALIASRLGSSPVATALRLELKHELNE
jgi:hypothetical protein